MNLEKYFNKQILINMLVYSVYIFILEIIVKICTINSILTCSTIRIILSSIILGFIFSLIISCFSDKISKTLGTFLTFGLALYTWTEINLYSYLGFFMGIKNAEQGGKVTEFISDFISSSKLISLLVIIPFIIYIFYTWFLNKKRIDKIKIRIRDLCYSMVLIIVLSFLYYYLLDASFMNNSLQVVKNTDLIKTNDNANLIVSQIGLYPYAISDMIVSIFKVNSDPMIYNGDTITSQNISGDLSRTFDDTSWQNLINSETDTTYNSLNNYFVNRDITPKNEYTGIFEGKNLIVVLMESVNMIAINEKEFPTLYKLYNEGISFRNNYSPRNNCSTGNNEMTVMTSLYTINNTCTANEYKDNIYPEAIFNMFNKNGYITTSFHDYDERYYYRKVIHPNMGSSIYRNVIDLGMNWNKQEWPSDVEFVEKAYPYFINDNKFMTFLITVSTHHSYNVSSTLNNKYLDNFKEYPYSIEVKRYMSKVKELDNALGALLNKLEADGKLDDTVIALFGDHYPYGLKSKYISEVLNYDVTVNKEIDRTPMVIYNSQTPSKKIYKYTSLIDLLPTLFNMFNIDYDPRLYLGTDIMSNNPGRVVFSDGSWQDEIGYYDAPTAKFIPNNNESNYTSEKLTRNK